ncbi:MAG: RHS repeat-associated core domain-containing protein, partial [Kiritimatiellae bacterium]|nr:RHS repeat-associated core domain-containing protein [Kiritimatiellia bacterium]
MNDTLRQKQLGHADGLGSIAVLTDESGATVQTYTYAAFGSIRTQTGTDLNRITYTAREAMGDSLGFFYYRHRIYDPHTARFTSEDPLGFVDGASRYVYVGNNPVNMVDPKGEFEVLSTLAAAAVVYSAYKL